MISSQTFFQSSELETLVEKLEGKKAGDGYLCKCPAHDDKKQSLSLSESSAVGILYRCHAGCSQEEVGKALARLLGKEAKEKVVKGNFPKKRKEPDVIYDKYRGFQKLRFNISPGVKEFSFRYKDDLGNWVYKKPKGVIGLYNIDKLDRLKGKAPVIICEGEKDCETLDKALGDSYIPVTNDTGAAGWNKNYGQLLNGLDVIICEHCDIPGEERTQKIISTGYYNNLLGVLKFTVDEVGEKGDVSDWMARGHTVDELRERLSKLVPIEKPQDTGKATYEDYILKFHELFPRNGKDIFSGNILYYDTVEKSWNPVENYLGEVRSIVRDETIREIKKYSASAVEDHFNKWSRSLEPKFLIDIPEWDQKDNIGSLCQHIRLDPECKVSELCFMALVKEWMANLFRKLKDPTMTGSPSREFILILTGEEYIGKDYWIDSLLCGLGQFFNPMTILNNERDNLMQLHQGLVLYIDEFDRSAKLETSFLKSIVTKPSTNLRSSYARKEQRRFSRTNFIASCNLNDLLRDHGKNTRYAIFELKEIKRDYKKSLDFSLQCLAQAKHLAEIGYAAPKDIWKEMSDYIASKTPEDPNKEIAEIYESTVSKWLDTLNISNPTMASDIREEGWAASATLNEVFIEVAKKTYGSLRRTKAALVAQKYSVRTPTTRGFLIKKN